MRKNERLVQVSGISLVLNGEPLQDKEVYKSINELNLRIKALEKALKRVGIVVY